MATRTSLTRLDAGAFRRTDEGYLQAKVNPTRIGVFTYVEPDGTVAKEFRPPEEVSRADSLSTLDHKVVTDDHPAALLTAKTTRQHGRGHMTAPHTMDADGIHTLSEVTVTDGDLIAKIEDGKQQVSCGYTCDIEDTPGEWQGERYDRIQRNIKYNHLAIVHRGRAGSARLRSDEAGPVARFDAWEVDDDAPQHDSPTHQPSGSASAGPERADQSDSSTNRRRPMPTIRIDNRDHECSDVLQIALETKFKADSLALTKAQDEAQKARTDAEAAATQAKKEYDALKAKYDDAAEKALTPEALAKLVNERADALSALRVKAAQFLGKDFKFDGLDEAAIKRAVVAKVKPELKLDGQSAEYIAMRFDIACEDAATGTPAHRNPVLDHLDSASRADGGDWATRCDLAEV